MWNAVRSVPLGVVDQNVRVSVVQRNQIADVLVGGDHPSEFLFCVLLRALPEIAGDVGEELLGCGLAHWRGPIVMYLNVRWRPCAPWDPSASAALGAAFSIMR